MITRDEIVFITILVAATTFVTFSLIRVIKNRSARQKFVAWCEASDEAETPKHMFLGEYMKERSGSKADEIQKSFFAKIQNHLANENSIVIGIDRKL